MAGRYNSFGAYIRNRFGAHVHKVNVDAGFTCPNRDGTAGHGGCIYCNNDSFKPGSCRPALSVTEQIDNGIKYLSRRYKTGKFLVYFQPYTNTYAPVDKLEGLYSEALSDPSVIGLAIGTRPDCIDPEKLDMLERLAKRHFILIEYGLQSIHDRTLAFINRGHDFAAFLNAVDSTRARQNLHVGVHTIMGFPTETRSEMLAMADALNDTGIEFMKVHQLQVIKGTKMAELYERERFHVFGYREYVDFMAEFIGRLSPSIVLQRLFAAAPDDILIAPRWDRGRDELLRDIDRRLEELDSFQGKFQKIMSAI